MNWIETMVGFQADKTGDSFGSFYNKLKPLILRKHFIRSLLIPLVIQQNSLDMNFIAPGYKFPDFDPIIK